MVVKNMLISFDLRKNQVFDQNFTDSVNSLILKTIILKYNNNKERA